MSGPGVVIVGAGTAGLTAATTLRAGGFDGPITLIGDEPEPPYRRTALTKDLCAADLSPERISLAEPNMWAATRIELIRGFAVVAVDPGRRTVCCADGREFGYRALVLATGASAARPDWLAPTAPTVRTLGEAVAIRDAIRRSGRLAVVGGGLIGLELAASAATHGTVVEVVEAAERVAARVVPAEVADWLRGLHESHGVAIRTGAFVESADADRIQLTDGTRVDGPVVAAVGMAPNVELARSAGIETVQAGVVVDRSFATSEPGVFAVGDVAAVPDALTDLPAACGHWFGATDQGRAVAAAVRAHLDGAAPEPFREVPRAWTVQYGVNVQMVGWPVAGGDVQIDGSLEHCDASVRVSIDGELIGAVTVGRAAAARACRTEIAAGLGSIV